MRFLVIDESTAMRQMIVGALGQLGHTDIVEAATPQQALEQLAMGRFDAVLTDWVLTELSGTEFVRAMRALESSRQVPVIVVTAHATRDHVMAAIKAGVNGYIVKPFTVDTLAEKIDAAVQRRYAASV
jgi:two-component system chemotaxis response regulator CheY